MMEKIKSKSKVIVDSDLSKEKIRSLIGLEIEEEALDFKESLDFKSSQKRSQLELVRDIVAMANTEGGYIILGVEDKSFKVKGIDDECKKNVTQENLQTWVENYIDGRIKVLCKQITIEGKSIIAIFVDKTKIPLVLKKTEHLAKQTN